MESTRLANLSMLRRLNVLIYISTRRRPPIGGTLPAWKRGQRYLHTTRHVYGPGPRTQQDPSKSQSRNGPKHGSGRASQKTTSNILRIISQTIQGVLFLLVIHVAFDATGLSTAILSLLRGRALNEDFFVPFTITSKEQVSPTAFILTIRPKYGRRKTKLTQFYRDTHVDSLSAVTSKPGLFKFYWPLFMRATQPHGPALAAAWSHGLWSVEIRQPQLQVARDYTPLPPRRGLSTEAIEEDVESGELRLLIRRLDNGEVSTYLSRLGVGDDVDLRGPHLGYDVRARLGDDSKVVFLAGGTGISPALQVASKLLDGGAVAEPQDRPAISVIWANRHRADCEGCGGGGGRPGGAIVEQLAEIQARHPGKFTVQCTVDEERTFITGTDVSRALGPPTTAGQAAPGLSSADCHLHAQGWVAARPAKETAGEEECHCEAPDGHRGGGGKNLLFVSGPEGFVDAYAGPKRWAGGQELQGTLAGLLGGLKKRDPVSWRDWLVLKL